MENITTATKKLSNGKGRISTPSSTQNAQLVANSSGTNSLVDFPPSAENTRECWRPQRDLVIPECVKEAVDSCSVRAGINGGPLLRSINKAGRTWGHSFTPKVIWAIVKTNAKSCGLTSVAPHDLRQTCARLCHQAGGDLEQSLPLS